MLEGKTNSPLWSPRDPAQTNTQRFTKYVNKKRGLDMKTYDELYKWSVTRIEDFWSDVWDYTGTTFSKEYHTVLEKGKTMDQIPEWFVGARMNYTQNVLEPYKTDARTAIYSLGEGRPLKELSFADLYDKVRLTASAMRNAGVGVGDRIAGYVPNIAESVIVLLAAASIGAIWSSTSLDFGATAVLDRFAQVEPKLLFSTDATGYNGKVFSHIDKLCEVAKQLPSVERVIVIPFHESEASDITPVPNACTWNEFISSADQDADLVYEQLPFSHPIYILFSSGTTGKPKCLVHSAGGMLLQHRKEHSISQDLGVKDILFYYTTTGWMMWNWLVGALSVGTSIVVYEGSPFKPSTGAIWSLIDELGITAFGTSAKYIQSLEDMQYIPRKHHKLDTLRAIYSTASPLKPNSFDFVYNHIKSDLCLSSITGGTDICSLFCGANVSLPVYRGEIQARGLGMAVESWADNRKPVVGASGDLVCTKPFPCMPVFFWGDKDGSRYRSAYFDYYPNIWYHGDFVIISPETGGVHMLGRSDGTLNPAGVRFGSAELYNIVDTYPEVADSLVVGQRQGVDERVLMFIQMADGHEFSQDIVKRISTQIRSKLSPRHVPALIRPITGGIPYTVNGKKVEIAVKRLVSDLYRASKEVGVHEATLRVKVDEKTTSTLANPESLLQFYQMPEILE